MDKTRPEGGECGSLKNIVDGITFQKMRWRHYMLIWIKFQEFSTLSTAIIFFSKYKMYLLVLISSPKLNGGSKLGLQWCWNSDSLNLAGSME